MDYQKVIYRDLGIIDYKSAWDYQEELVAKNREIKSEAREAASYELRAMNNAHYLTTNYKPRPTGSSGRVQTTNYLLFCEHPPVYTLGKSGSMKNVLLSEHEMEEKEIEFFKTNRGGDITFHGLQQVVGYPILDMENFYTDIGRYLRELEEVIIMTIAGYGIKGDRSKGETGVWIDPGVP
ncbi:MAG TPA: lipoyl(octanoyl) transferase LipB, partial [Chitinophagaceae bacterium]|nr:lipoyl(octanoyl) transferase LipB [Chitinophagaceae bacterium]